MVKKMVKNYNVKLPRIFILSLLTVSPYLHKDPPTISCIIFIVTVYFGRLI